MWFEIQIKNVKGNRWSKGVTSIFIKIIDKKIVRKEGEMEKKKNGYKYERKSNVNISKHLLGLAEFPHLFVRISAQYIHLGYFATVICGNYILMYLMKQNVN